MKATSSADEFFLKNITRIISENLADENFGAEELVLKSGMTRYLFSKRLRSITGKNINQFIRETRLRHALEMLRSNTVTMSEVAYRTGFSSPAYFNKCFHDLYGYPPGQVKSRNEEKGTGEQEIPESEKKRTPIYKYVIAGILFSLVIALLILYDKVPGMKDKKSVKASVAIMPFQNLTNRPDLHYWSRAIQRDLISALSSTGEIEVRAEGSIDTILSRPSIIRTNLFGGSARKIAGKLDADYFITGSIQKFEREMRLDAHLAETSRNTVIRTVELNSSSDSEIELRSLIDTIRKQITESMLMEKIISRNPYYQHLFSTPQSITAMRYYDNAYRSQDPAEDIMWLKKALKADSTFSRAALALEYAYSANNQRDSSYYWLKRNYSNRFRMSEADRLKARWAYAFTFEPFDVQIDCLTALLRQDPEEPFNQYTLGLIYCLSGEYENAIPRLEKSYRILLRWGRNYLKEPQNCRNFKWLGIAYHNTGRYKDERRLYRRAGNFIKGHPWYDLMQANLAFIKNDTANAHRHIRNSMGNFRKTIKDEANILVQIGRYFKDVGNFDVAEDYFRKALLISPDDIKILTLFADFCCISNRHNDPDLMDRGISLSSDTQTYCEFLAEKGMCLHAMKRHDEAVGLLQKAYDEAPFKVYRFRYFLDHVKNELQGN